MEGRFSRLLDPRPRNLPVCLCPAATLFEAARSCDHVHQQGAHLQIQMQIQIQPASTCSCAVRYIPVLLQGLHTYIQGLVQYLKRNGFGGHSPTDRR